jgi:hypothetical protein
MSRWKSNNNLLCDNHLMNDDALQYVLAWIVGLAGVAICFFGHGVLMERSSTTSSPSDDQQAKHDRVNRTGLEISTAVLLASYVSLKASYLLGYCSTTADSSSATSRNSSKSKPKKKQRRPH